MKKMTTLIVLAAAAAALIGGFFFIRARSEGQAGEEEILLFESEALDRMKCTRIVIAHRLSTIRQCDRIIVLDGGHIIEDGTYEELIEKKGFFAELVSRQRLDQTA